MGLIDLHSHVLPGIDDGPADTAGAVALAREAAAGGVGVLAATPHLRHDYPGVRVHELAGRVGELRTALAEAGVGIEIVAGGEVDVYWAAHADDEQLALASYGQRGRDLLVETPYGDLPPVFEELVFALRARGFRLLLAHPERSPALRAQPERLAALVRSGILVQVTAGALAARSRRSRSHRFALELVKEGVAHVIASDAHAAGPGRPSLREGVAAAARVAPGRAQWMATDAPAAVLSGEPLPAPPQAARRRLPALLRRPAR